MFDFQGCQKCIEFTHKMGSIIRRYGHKNSKSEDHLFCEKFGTLQCSCTGHCPSFGPLCQRVSTCDNTLLPRSFHR